jgi:iron complex transport system ATP-binding protein
MDRSPTAALRVRNLCASYGPAAVLRTVSFELPAASILGIIGRNGAGKSTLLKCLNGLHRPDSGEVTVMGEALHRMSMRHIARCVGYVPQRSHDEHMTVFESVLIGRRPHIRFQASRKDLALVQGLLEYVGLHAMAFRSTREISGGEFQKVLIARALVSAPEIVLLDEPTNNLDLESQVKVMQLLTHSAREHGMTIVMSVHDVNAAFQYADYLLLLNNGEVLKYARTTDIAQPDLERIYNVPLAQCRLNGNPVFMPRGDHGGT